MKKLSLLLFSSVLLLTACGDNGNENVVTSRGAESSLEVEETNELSSMIEKEETVVEQKPVYSDERIQKVIDATAGNQDMFEVEWVEENTAFMYTFKDKDYGAEFMANLMIAKQENDVQTLQTWKEFSEIFAKMSSQSRTIYPESHGLAIVSPVDDDSSILVVTKGKIIFDFLEEE